MSVRAFLFPIAMVGTLAVAEPPRYTMVEITGLPAGPATGMEIDEQGRVLVVVRTANGGVDRSYLWTEGQLSPLPALQGQGRCITRAMSADGLIGGSCGPFDTLVPTLWRNGAPEVLPVFGTDQADVMDMSPNGNICGYAKAFDEQTGWHGFAVIDGTLHDLGPTPFNDLSSADAINDEGVVARSWPTHRDRVAPFLWDATHGMRELPTLGGFQTGTTDINNRGEVVGWSENGRVESISENHYKYPVRWDAEGRIGQLPLPTGYPTGQANAISEAGVAVGEASHFDFSPFLGVIWVGGEVHILNDTTTIPPGWSIRTASDINDRGEILVQVEVNSQRRVAVLRPE
jgi:uncharacterized membrane protein